MICKLGRNFWDAPIGWQNFIESLNIIDGSSAFARRSTIDRAVLENNVTYRRAGDQLRIAELEFTEEKYHTMFVLKYGSLESSLQ